MSPPAASHDDDAPQISASCCSAASVRLIKPSEYRRRGKIVDVPGASPPLQVYVSEPAGGVRDASRAVLSCYDVIGWGHPNAFQACDVFADLTGWVCVSPDFFRGQPWTADSMEELGGLPGMTKWAHEESGKGPWVGRVGPGNWESQVGDDCRKVVDMLKGLGAKKVHYAGFCYGGLTGLKFSAQIPEAGGCALFHPAWLTNQLASQCKSGVMLMPASNDPEYKDVFATLQANKNVPHAAYEFFADQIHGFASARGDFADPNVYAGAMRAYGLAAEFWKQEDEKTAGKGRL
ncbi:hypothetical protein DFJ74DRAFT_259710 [Hyaloraphidium curvatum]|nr:hypothetical protein DFJ74DRAFT_259710 [Hyaloraphidium curvatum]